MQLMQNPLPYILFSMGALYAFIDLFLWWKLQKLPRNTHRPMPTKAVSIMVCARNEAQNIGTCLRSLIEQNYPLDHFEILVANDRSTDETLQIIQEFAAKYHFVHFIDIKETPLGHSPKKFALSQLIQIAHGEIILNTDADCQLKPHWIQTMCDSFDSETHMVLGRSDFLVPPTGKNTFWGFQALDFLSHGVVAAAGVAAGIPINSTGNSLAYRKSTFDKLSGFENLSHIASGDDDLLYHKFCHAYPRGIRFCFDPGGAALTHAESTLRGFWEQRKRWASKTVHYTPSSIALLFGVFCFYFTIIISPLLSLLTWNLNWFGIGLGLFLIKVTADAYPLFYGMKLFQRKDLMRYYPITALLHAPYIVAAASLGVLGKFNWKGNSMQRALGGK